MDPPGSAPFGLANAYSKLVVLPEMADLREEHLVISKEQRALADDPRNQCRPPNGDELLKAGKPTGYEVRFKD